MTMTEVLNDIDDDEAIINKLLNQYFLDKDLYARTMGRYYTQES
jgi:hypothetical protein